MMNVQAEREELGNATQDHYHGGRKVDNTAARRRNMSASCQLERPFRKKQASSFLVDDASAS